MTLAIGEFPAQVLDNLHPGGFEPDLYLFAGSRDVPHPVLQAEAEKIHYATEDLGVSDVHVVDLHESFRHSSKAAGDCAFAAERDAASYEVIDGMQHTLARSLGAIVYNIATERCAGEELPGAVDALTRQVVAPTMLPIRIAATADNKYHIRSYEIPGELGDMVEEQGSSAMAAVLFQMPKSRNVCGGDRIPLGIDTDHSKYLGNKQGQWPVLSTCVHEHKIPVPHTVSPFGERIKSRRDLRDTVARRIRYLQQIPTIEALIEQQGDN